MFIQPIYNILLLPDITYYFKKDFFAERSDKLQPGEDVLFMMLRTENEGQTFRRMISIPSDSPRRSRIFRTRMSFRFTLSSVWKS